MRNAILLVGLVLLCLGLGAQEGTDNFFDDSNDSVLQEARRRHSDKGEARAEDDLKPKKESPNDEAGPEKDRKRAKYSLFTFSILPGLQFPSGVNNTSLSLGMIGSINRSVMGLSVSSAFDIASADFTGLQAAGAFCIVGGDMAGIQGSGGFNVVGGDMLGIQASGGANFAGDLVGLQAAGGINAARHLSGFQLGGGLNMANDLSGGQLAGGMNIARDLSGAQLGGAVNIAHDLSGGQLAGALNIAHNVRGFQLAGASNLAHDVRGAQISGGFNLAHEVHGTQIGMVNISDSLYGVPIGLVSYVRTGIHDAGAWIDGGKAAYAFLACGSNDNYSIVYCGEAISDMGTNMNSLVLGLGLGHRFLFKPLQLDVEVSAKNHIAESGNLVYGFIKGDQQNPGPQAGGVGAYTICPNARIVLGLPLFKGLELFGGASLDVEGGYCDLPEGLKNEQPFSLSIDSTDLSLHPRLFFGLRL